MEIAKLFASIGIKFNEQDLKQVDSQIKKIRSQLKAVSANIRVKVDPIAQTAGKTADAVAQKANQMADPKKSARLAKEEESLRRAIGHMEASLQHGRVSAEKEARVTAKLSATIHQLSAVLKEQGRKSAALTTQVKADKVAVKAESVEDKYKSEAEAERQKAMQKAQADANKKIIHEGRLGASPSTKQAANAKTRFGQKQGSARNVLQEIGLSSQVATSKLNTALVNIQAINREAKKFGDTPFKIEGFKNALSAVNSDIRGQVKAITQSGASQEDQLKQLLRISDQVEQKLMQLFKVAKQADLPKVGTSAISQALSGKQVESQALKAASITPRNLEDKIATLETRSGARGGFKSIKEQAELIEAIELRKRQALVTTANLAKKLTSDDVATRRAAAATIKSIQSDITRVSAIENRARARQVMDTNRQIQQSFRTMAKSAFTSMNNMRIIATTATGAMASFAGITPFIQDNRTLEQLNSAFLAITGSAKDAKMMMDFINNSSDKLGLSFKTVAQASKSFTAATTAQGVSLEETQEMLTGVFKASRVLGLSSEDTQGAVRALSQMFGKVNVSAEELKSRLAA